MNAIAFRPPRPFFDRAARMNRIRVTENHDRIFLTFRERINPQVLAKVFACVAPGHTASFYRYSSAVRIGVGPCLLERHAAHSRDFE